MSYTIDELHNYVSSKNTKAIKSLINDGFLVIKEGKLFVTDLSKEATSMAASFWDQRQLARKILLNSLYGALLNESCRFYRKDIGQSVTLTGRSIAKHMNSKVNECITGEYQYDGTGIVYADTDSSYFSAYEMMKSDPQTAELADDKEAMLDLYLSIGDTVNESFPIFMNNTFNTGIDRGKIIAAGLELVSETGMFIKKKRYAVLKYWDESSGRLDGGNKPGKIKAMGLDLKRADTPKYMQDFLSEILLEILLGEHEDVILNKIKEFRETFRQMEPWMKGTPKKVNGLTAYTERMERFELPNDIQARQFQNEKLGTIPGHVLASINWNKMLRINSDKYSSSIIDGGKVIVCKLLPNPMKMSSIAYPYDQTHLPDWFKRLPFDNDLMEETIIDKKVSNLIGVLQWDLKKTREDTTFNDLFTF